MGSESVPECLFEFQSEGEAGAEELRELEAFLRQEFAGWKLQGKPTPPREGVRADPVLVGLAVAGLVLAVPGAIVNTWNLVERGNLKEKLVRLIAWAKERRRAGVKRPKITIVVPPHGEVLELDKARAEEILDAIGKMAEKGTRSS